MTLRAKSDDDFGAFGVLGDVLGAMLGAFGRAVTLTVGVGTSDTSGF